MKRAAALRYSESDEAPIVISSGEGELARRIERSAREHGVPIVHNVALADALAELQAGDTIPEALYEAVAAVLRELAGDG